MFSEKLIFPESFPKQVGLIFILEGTHISWVSVSHRSKPLTKTSSVEKTPQEKPPQKCPVEKTPHPIFGLVEKTPHPIFGLVEKTPHPIFSKSPHLKKNFKTVLLYCKV